MFVIRTALIALVFPLLELVAPLPRVHGQDAPAGGAIREDVAGIALPVLERRLHAVDAVRRRFPTGHPARAILDRSHESILDRMDHEVAARNRMLAVGRCQLLDIESQLENALRQRDGARTITAEYSGVVSLVPVAASGVVAGDAVLLRMDATDANLRLNRLMIALGAAELAACEAQLDHLRLLDDRLRGIVVAGSRLRDARHRASEARRKLDTLRALHGLAQRDVARCTLRAPRHAVWITAVHVRPGELVRAGQPLFSVRTTADVDPLVRLLATTHRAETARAIALQARPWRIQRLARVYRLMRDAPRADDRENRASAAREISGLRQELIARTRNELARIAHELNAIRLLSDRALPELQAELETDREHLAALRTRLTDVLRELKADERRAALRHESEILRLKIRLEVLRIELRAAGRAREWQMTERLRREIRATEHELEAATAAASR